MDGLIELIEQCRPDNVSTGIIQQVISVESGGNELAININGGKLSVKPKNKEELINIAKSAIKQGYSVDIGLMQINSNNFKALGYTLEELVDPCNNIKAGSLILRYAYLKSTETLGEGQEALQQALSIYNTGHYKRGFNNGYVNRYYPKQVVLKKDNYLVNALTSQTTIYVNKKEEN